MLTIARRGDRRLSANHDLFLTPVMLREGISALRPFSALGPCATICRMKKLLLVLLTAIGLMAALRALLRLLATSSITDEHLRSVTRVEYSVTMLAGGAIAYFAWRAASRRPVTK